MKKIITEDVAAQKKSGIRSFVPANIAEGKLSQRHLLTLPTHTVMVIMDGIMRELLLIDTMR